MTLTTTRASSGTRNVVLWIMAVGVLLAGLSPLTRSDRADAASVRWSPTSVGVYFNKSESRAIASGAQAASAAIAVYLPRSRYGAAISAVISLIVSRATTAISSGRCFYVVAAFIPPRISAAGSYVGSSCR